MDHASPVRTPFDWLRDPNDRGSALRQIEWALDRGWLDPAAADMVPLKAALAELVDDSTTTAAQRRRMLRMLAVLDRPADARERRPPPPAQPALRNGVREVARHGSRENDLYG